MPNLYLFFSHTFTPEQIKDAKESLRVDDFIYLPKDLQNLFSNVPPELESLDEYKKPFEEYLLKNAKKGDFVLLQGDFGLVCSLVGFSKKLGLIPVYATTKRVAKEKIIDGKTVKISEFHHIRFRRYE